ncbi:MULTISPECIES: polysaccharide deacetylase family protein [Paenibacillus]|uniref:polysaccharide deacetylase family protein n=1 Tax=Paenibacillus TaxID=44249 RepID=UPI0022B93135|nr:polysaccharide deacetylase family protein [Paenibacillus caseinilyticus]MCZ8523030.1 polysaccharide deacetylase family protein [Paenibacillus caseinilyticus]
MPHSILVHEVNTDRKAVAFTFDDGPHPIYTPQLLDIFRAYGGRATFYVIGEHLERYEDTARRCLEEGHELGNHTYTHPYLTRLSQEQCRMELVRTGDRIEALTGRKPATFRPPYLDFDEGAAALTDELGYAVIGAVNMGAEDWRQPGVEHILQATRSAVRPGGILLFHDGYQDREQTVEAVGILVPELLEQGYELVTVSELLSSKNLE